MGELVDCGVGGGGSIGHGRVVLTMVVFGGIDEPQ